EENYDNFIARFNQFRENVDHLRQRLFQNHGNIPERDRLQNLCNELKNLYVKLRLAFGMEEIRLNPFFVDEKYDELKLCHLLYYKIADLWFAYESYIIFYTKVFQASKNKILWLDAITHKKYSDFFEITHSLEL